MSNRPARRARDKAQSLLIIEPVNLINHAINVIAQGGTLPLNRRPMLQKALRLINRDKSRINAKAPIGKAGHHAGLRVRRHGAHLAPSIGKKLQRALLGHFDIELAQTTRRRIARIGENLAALFFLSLIQGREIWVAHINLAAHLNNIGHTRRQLMRNIGQRSEIGGNVFADAPIAARRALHQHTLLIAQTGRQAINLRL